MSSRDIILVKVDWEYLVLDLFGNLLIKKLISFGILVVIKYVMNVSSMVNF